MSHPPDLTARHTVRDRADALRAARDAEIHRAVQHAQHLPPPLGEAIAALLQAAELRQAGDGQLSFSALTLDCPEMLQLARAVTALVERNGRVAPL